jgi:alginate O-acetyltransferase complex protein AlgI
LVIIGWVFFRAADVAGAMRMFKGMAGLHGLGLTDPMSWQVVPERLLVLVLGIGLVYAMPWLRAQRGSVLRYALIPLFVWAVDTLSSQSFTPFLYFQF